MQHINILVLSFFCYMLEFENLVFVKLYVITLSACIGGRWGYTTYRLLWQPVISACGGLNCALWAQ